MVTASDLADSSLFACAYSVSNNQLGPEDAKAFADALHVNASLTSVNLLSNKMDIESATVLLKVKAEKSMLRTLCGLTHEEIEINLQLQGLGPADAMLLAPEVSVMTSLTSVCVPPELQPMVPC